MKAGLDEANLVEDESEKPTEESKDEGEAKESEKKKVQKKRAPARLDMTRHLMGLSVE